MKINRIKTHTTRTKMHVNHHISSIVAGFVRAYVWPSKKPVTLKLNSKNWNSIRGWQKCCGGEFLGFQNPDWFDRLLEQQEGTNKNKNGSQHKTLGSATICTYIPSLCSIRLRRLVFSVFRWIHMIFLLSHIRIFSLLAHFVCYSHMHNEQHSMRERERGTHTKKKKKHTTNSTNM